MAKRIPVPATTPEILSAFVSKVRFGDGCWDWLGSTFTQGYGSFSLARKNRRAHRIFYVWLFGELDEGMELDHACNNRLCVRPGPEHVRPLLQKANVMRASIASPSVANALKTHCKRGHAFTEANTHLVGGKLRRCRECERIKQRDAYRSAHPNCIPRGPYHKARDTK